MEQPLTQEQMLLEAAFTEIHNERSLAVLLAREEAAKARSSLKAEPYTGPILRFRSRRKEGEEEVRGGGLWVAGFWGSKLWGSRLWGLRF